jgi:radical SAM mobile pair protein B
MKDILITEIKTSNIMTKSTLPVGGYSVNPYVGCIHACKYCYACFMKRFTGHSEEWGTFLDVKYWDKIKNPQKYKGQLAVIGSVTDGYNPLEEKYKRTRTLLEELQNSGAKIMICTKSDLVCRDLDILTKMENVTISFSINTLDEKFKDDMDAAVSIERRLAAMKKCYDAGVRTVCFVSPIFPEITDVLTILERAKEQCDFVWLENLNLRGEFKSGIMEYIETKYPHLISLYKDIYVKNDRSYWECLDKKVAEYADKYQLKYINNYLPDGRSEKGKPIVINYFYHEQIKGSENTGKRKI